MRSDASTDADSAAHALTASFGQLGLSSHSTARGASRPLAPFPPPGHPCALCGVCLPSDWSSDSAMSYYFSRLRQADSADVSGKMTFWAPLLKQSQAHQRCTAAAATAVAAAAAATATDTVTSTTATTATSTPSTATTAATTVQPWLSFTLQDMQHRFTRVSGGPMTSNPRRTVRCCPSLSDCSHPALFAFVSFVAWRYSVVYGGAAGQSALTGRLSCCWDRVWCVRRPLCCCCCQCLLLSSGDVEYVHLLHERASELTSVAAASLSRSAAPSAPVGYVSHFARSAGRMAAGAVWSTGSHLFAMLSPNKV